MTFQEPNWSRRATRRGPLRSPPGALLSGFVPNHPEPLPEMALSADGPPGSFAGTSQAVRPRRPLSVFRRITGQSPRFKSASRAKPAASGAASIMSEWILGLVPFWLFGLSLVLACILASEFGRGVRRRLISPAEAGTKSDAQAYVVGAVFGLLAFLISLTFTIAINRFDERRGWGAQEANAISTTVLACFPARRTDALEAAINVERICAQPDLARGHLERRYDRPGGA